MILVKVYSHTCSNGFDRQFLVRPAGYEGARNHKDGKRIPLEVKKEDRVLFGKYAGNEVNVAGVEHLIMREDDILGIIVD